MSKRRHTQNKEHIVTNPTQVDEPVNPFSDDVEDVPAGAVEETDTPVADATPTTGDKPAKAEKTPARPPVPEGYITPVEFAKVLTKHLKERNAVDTQGRPFGDGEGEIVVKPQIVYSYLKNNGPESKNPIPQYENMAGRKVLLKTDEVLAWWDAKDERVAASKASAKEKAAKKSEKVKTEDAPTADEGVAVEAE
jgi:hypothetical protein